MIPSIFGMCCSCKRKETPEDTENIQQRITIKSLKKKRLCLSSLITKTPHQLHAPRIECVEVPSVSRVMIFSYLVIIFLYLKNNSCNINSHMKLL